MVRGWGAEDDAEVSNGRSLGGFGFGMRGMLDAAGEEIPIPKPFNPLRSFDLVSVAPITPSVLHVIIENKLINGSNQVKVPFPRNIIRLKDGYLIYCTILLGL